MLLTWIVFVFASSVPATFTFCPANFSGAFWSESTYTFFPSTKAYWMSFGFDFTQATVHFGAGVFPIML